jgi:hypothetical protein
MDGRMDGRTDRRLEGWVVGRWIKKLTFSISHYTDIQNGI